MEVAAKKMAHDEAAKELIKRSEARMQSIAAARRKVADSEAARQQAEAKAKADSQVLADLLADDCGVGELDARLKQLKSEKDIALAKVKALS
jgi:two-component sensor histidine kinase